MKKLSFALIFLFLQIGCQNQQISYTSSENIVLPKQTDSANMVFAPSNENISSETPNDDKIYPGKTIDQIFPIIEGHDFTEKSFKEKIYSVKVDKFEVTVNDFAPKTITEDEKNIFKFKTLYPNNYHSNLVGFSHLLGTDSKQIYVVAGGPGAVCCTNYWITDVSGNTPRNIFRSEDFGSFRNPMEIFDADGDGIYELVRFDSAFRYFMDDCGACSPEPRAVFKYNKKLDQYVPAKNIQQDFVKKSFLETEKWIIESFEKLKKFEKNKDTKNQEYISLLFDYNSRFLEYVVDIFYLGDEIKAWRIFEKYHNGYNKKEDVREEIKKRLIESKFYQALKKA